MLFINRLFVIKFVIDEVVVPGSSKAVGDMSKVCKLTFGNCGSVY